MGTTGDRTGYGSWWWAPAVVAVVVLAVGIGLLVTPLVAAAGATRPGTTVSERTVGSLGPVLVDGNGQTLYVYATDRPGHVTCTGRCAAVWPPLLLPKGVTKPVGPTSAALGTVRRPGGRFQVTSHRLPLYRYVGDRRAGQANGEGVEDTWFVATPTGHRPAATPSPSSTRPLTTPTTPTTTTAPLPAARSASTPTTTAPPMPPPTTVVPTTSPAPATTAPAPAATPTPTPTPGPSPPPATTQPTSTTTTPPTTAPPSGGGVAY
jgi:predicted lipoprotein with Yx(FWY)xxD motif